MFCYMREAIIWSVKYEDKAQVFFIDFIYSIYGYRYFERRSLGSLKKSHKYLLGVYRNWLILKENSHSLHQPY